MSNIQPYIVKDESGAEYTVYIQTDDDLSEMPSKSPKRGDDIWEDESYSPNRPRSGTVANRATLVQLHTINNTIRTYAKFVIDAFKNMGGAEVEELNFKFGLKFSGGAEVPILVKGSAESNFEVEVKCKFPKDSSQNDG